MTVALDRTTRVAAAQAGAPAVLQVLPALDLGGAERGAVDVAKALARGGFRAAVASSGGRLVRELERAGARHVELPLDRRDPFTIQANVRRLARVIEEDGFDLVHARSRAPAWSARAAARRTGRPFVTTFHGVYGTGTLLKRAYNAIMAKGDRVIAGSNFVADHIRTRYRADDARLRVIPRGIDTDLFDPARVNAERLITLARRWSLPDGAPVVMLPGRLARWKGHALLIDALARLGRDDLVVVLVGLMGRHGAYRRELERRAIAGGLGGRIRFIEHCADMPAAYMLADVVVSASTEPEAFGRVAVEAQAMGRPVVASDHGASAETVAAGDTGWLVPRGDAQALGAAIDAALGLDGEARGALAKRARERVLRLFTTELMCTRTLDLYRELLAERRTPQQRIARS
ncbi:MAG: glycosyltransferase family 4 protein [Alphaproteobacteria bacterium]